MDRKIAHRASSRVCPSIQQALDTVPRENVLQLFAAVFSEVQ
jgi:hypothetical protein